MLDTQGVAGLVNAEWPVSCVCTLSGAQMGASHQEVAWLNTEA